VIFITTKNRGRSPIIFSISVSASIDHPALLCCFHAASLHVTFLYLHRIGAIRIARGHGDNMQPNFLSTNALKTQWKFFSKNLE